MQRWGQDLGVICIKNHGPFEWRKHVNVNFLTLLFLLSRNKECMASKCYVNGIFKINGLLNYLFTNLVLLYLLIPVVTDHSSRIFIL